MPSDPAWPSALAVWWRPGEDTAVALATVPLMAGIYYVGTHPPTDIVGTLVFVVAGNGLVDVLLPAYYVLRRRGEPLAGLGLTSRRWKLAAALSVAATAISLPGLRRELATHPDVDLWPTVLANGLLLWEPFFVYGWLQLRFERAFGLLPGLALAAASFGAYHLGSVPPAGAGALAVLGLVFGSLFRVTRNLLTLWPLTWAIASSIGTIEGGIRFRWGQVATYAALLGAQASAIAWLAHHPPRGPGQRG